jgi:aminoglycoside phosphotransferase family enzyme
MSPTARHYRLYNARFRLDQVLEQMEADGKSVESILDEIARIIHRYTDRLEYLNSKPTLR